MGQRPGKDHPFGALAALRGRLATPQPDKPAPQPVQLRETGETGEVELFRAALGGVTPLATGNHAHIERPPPAPLPRPRVAEPETGPQRRAPAPDPNDAIALFRHEMADVTRLSDHGRVELGRRRAHAAVATLPPPLIEDARPVPPDAPWLPDHIDDPAALFRHAVGAAAPLPECNRAELARPLPAPQPKKREEDEAAVLRESISAPLSFEDRIDMGDEGVHLRDGLPRRVLTDLRRGRWVIQDELDLHGLTRDEARSALGHFLHAALEHGYRCVRLIHGKGLGSPGREPVLKHLSRGWLMQREEILAFCQARPHEGGDGALLVLLRAMATS